MHNRSHCWIWIVSVILSATPLFAEIAVTVSEMKKSLACQCDCGMTVDACEGAMPCESAKGLTKEVIRLINNGMDRDQVLASFVTRYGESILAAPTKRGFNLTAWILPFFSLFVAAVGIIVVLKRWTRLQESENDNDEINVSEWQDSAYERKLDEILRSLD